MTDARSFTPYTLPDDQRDQFLSAIRESLAINSGRGSSQYVAQTLLSRHDRFGNSAVQINAEHVGLTFFTKPRLNLSTASIRQDPTLAMLDTLDPQSWMFALRCNLDTRFANSPKIKGLAELSPWFNSDSPFNIPLSNMLVGISGWPDYSVDYETTETGYFSESMTFARGSDEGRRNYDLSCTFRDIQGGYLMAFFYYWLKAMSLQMQGTIVAYPQERASNRLNYTCSIYRFVMDPSIRTITKWAKATGCFPINIPIGEIFNYGPGDSFIHTSQQFTIPFKATVINYMDPRHLQAFNILVERYAGQDVGLRRGGWIKTEVSAEHNFAGVPYIDLFSGTNELMFLARPEELVDPTETYLAQIDQTLKNNLSQYSRATARA